MKAAYFVYGMRKKGTHYVASGVASTRSVGYKRHSAWGARLPRVMVMGGRGMTQLSRFEERFGRVDDDFRDFCGDIFCTLGRADQRRAGETYLYGLLNCPGRKSIRRMA